MASPGHERRKSYEESILDLIYPNGGSAIRLGGVNYLFQQIPLEHEHACRGMHRDHPGIDILLRHGDQMRDDVEAWFSQGIDDTFSEHDVKQIQCRTLSVIKDHFRCRSGYRITDPIITHHHDYQAYEKTPEILRLMMDISRATWSMKNEEMDRASLKMYSEFDDAEFSEALGMLRSAKEPAYTGVIKDLHRTHHAILAWEMEPSFREPNLDFRWKRSIPQIMRMTPHYRTKVDRQKFHEFVIGSVPDIIKSQYFASHGPSMEFITRHVSRMKGSSEDVDRALVARMLQGSFESSIRLLTGVPVPKSAHAGNDHDMGYLHKAGKHLMEHLKDPQRHFHIIAALAAHVTSSKDPEEVRIAEELIAVMSSTSS